MKEQKTSQRSGPSLLLILSVIGLTACGAHKASEAAQSTIESAAPEKTTPPKTPLVKAIKDAYEPYFSVGVAIAPHHIENVSDIITTHFNHVTAENDMKLGPIHPEADEWDYANADIIARFARDHKMMMTGHTLVWHRMQPDWLFAGLTPGDPASIMTLQSRLQNHIETIVARYSDVIDNWDVVNEAISDSPDKQYRDGSEGSKWHEIYGDETYVLDAFTFARQALEKAHGSAEGRLYYNDYNITLKLDKILETAKWLRDEKGIPVAGIGFQAHWNIDWPSVDDIEEAITRIVDAGFKIKISELDLSIYTNDDWENEKWEPERAFDAALQAEQAARYKALFELFRKHKDHITSVTLWGVSDDATWLDDFPAKARNNHPLLFDDQHAPKASVPAIVNF